MKNLRKISLLIIAILLAASLSGCFGRPRQSTDTDQTTTKQTKQTTANNGSTTQPETTRSESNDDQNPSDGMELTEFLDGYTNAKSPLWDKMSDAIEDGTDLAALSALMGMSMADMMILDVYFFDSVNELGGMIMFTAIDNAFKTEKGDTIEFGYDYIYSEEKADDNYPAGSHLTCVGSYNIKSGHIRKESIDDKGDDDKSRIVVEINKLADDSYISQIINSSNGETNAYFTFFKGTDIWTASGSKSDGVSFTYNSIYDKKVDSLDAMTEGFEITTRVSFIDDKVTFETNG